MSSQLASFYGGKRVLVTGHTGFKGAWLALWLHEMGARVAGYALEPERGIFEAIGLERCVEDHVLADVRNLDDLVEALARFQPEIVLHLAAQALVRRSYDDPVGTFATNVLGTVNVLEAVRRTPSVRVVVNVTTDKCYENREWVHGYRETDPMGGHDPYSSSKGCSELVTASYRAAFFREGGHDERFVALGSARAGNVIGGGDWSADRLIPDIVRAVEAGEPVVVRSPGAVRPWQHVLEPLSGYLQLAMALWSEPDAHASGWNFGPTLMDSLTVEEVVARAIACFGRGEYRVEPDPLRHEAQQLRLDISKAHALLGWRPVYDADRAVSETVRWYREHAENSDPRHLERLSRKQIGDYVTAAVGLGLAWAQGS